jgi:hypothetical protein
MLCALTTPSPEDLTDFGEIEPLIVWISFIDGETTSPCAGVAMTQSEITETNIRNLERITQLY